MNNIDKVLNIIEYIQRSNIINKEEYFSEKYATFKKNYPILFKTACADEKIDKKILSFMIQRLMEIKESEKTDHDASVEVGQMLFEKYVEPVKHLMTEKKT